MANFLIAYYDLGEVRKVSEKIKQVIENNKVEDNKNNKVEDNKVELFSIKVDSDLVLKEQFKNEKELNLLKKISTKKFDYIIIGTPIISFTSVPAVNIFIRQLKGVSNKKFILFATGIGLPGKAIKKMTSLLSMKKGKVVASKVFSSIFEFDERKLLEVEKFINETIK